MSAIYLLRMWFDRPEQTPQETEKKKMREIAAAADAEETGKIQKWLDLAKKMFDGDDDPTPSAA